MFSSFIKEHRGPISPVLKGNAQKAKNRTPRDQDDNVIRFFRTADGEKRELV